MFKPLVIAIDLDSTVCDLLTEWLRLYNEEYEAESTVGHMTQWSMSDNVSIGKEIYKYLSDADLYKRLEPFPGALETVRAFHDTGHEVHIVTAPTPGLDHTAADKLWWCRQHLGYLPYDRFSLLHSKERFICDVLIDDAPKNLERHAKLQPSSKRLGIAYPYNECAVGSMHLRADSYENPENAWKQIKGYVDSLASELA